MKDDKTGKDSGGNEFWRDLKPITKVFQPDASPEVYLPNIADDDMRY